MRKRVAACYLGPSNFSMGLLRFQQNIVTRVLQSTQAAPPFYLCIELDHRTLRIVRRTHRDPTGAGRVMFLLLYSVVNQCFLVWCAVGVGEILRPTSIITRRGFLSSCDPVNETVFLHRVNSS